MLSSNSPAYQHQLQDLALIAVSFSFLPLSTFILIVSLLVRIPLAVVQYARHGVYLRNTARRSRSPSPRRVVLVTGVGMTKGLTLARTFHLAGHRVIGADFSSFACGRFSSAVTKFYTLATPDDDDGAYEYIQELLHIIRHEKVHIWVSCSGVASAVEDAQAKEIIERGTDCRCIQYDPLTTQTLHSKDTFVAHTASLGLPVPETHNVTTRAAVHKVLHQSPRTRKQYILKNVGVDDASRSDIMTLLPRRTMSQTYNYIAHVPISPQNPWVLQQYVPGKKEYCTHALVVEGRVKAFVACPSAELLMHYGALPPGNALSKAMLRFTQEFVSRSSSVGSQSQLPPMTGHLSFDFLVDEVVTEKGIESVLRAIECNPRAHTAVVLFTGREQEHAKAYTAVLDKPTVKSGSSTSLSPMLNGYTSAPLLNNGDNNSPPTSAESIETGDIVTPLPSSKKYYWIGNDIVTLLLLPLLNLILLPSSFAPVRGYAAAIAAIVHSNAELIEHILLWKDGTYELWDPLPLWVLYHMYWPTVIWSRLRKGRKGWWSRINVGTCKVFAC